MEVKFPCLVGPPGAGKTHILVLCCLYALSKGYVCALTAITGERARVLDGEHVHSIFGFPVNKGTSLTSATIASFCLSFLTRNHLQFSYIKSIEVLFIEEIGLFPGHLMNAIDYILRKVEFSDKPFGGIFIISSGDHKQLKPVQGHQIWMSPDFIIQYSVLKLRHYVRCSGGHNLMAVLEVF